MKHLLAFHPAKIFRLFIVNIFFTQINRSQSISGIAPDTYSISEYHSVKKEQKHKLVTQYDVHNTMYVINQILRVNLIHDVHRVRDVHVYPHNADPDNLALLCRDSFFPLPHIFVQNPQDKHPCIDSLASSSRPHEVCPHRSTDFLLELHSI